MTDLEKLLELCCKYGHKSAIVFEIEFRQIKLLTEKVEKDIMQNCILSDFQTEVQSFMTMNDVKDLEELDTVFNNLKQKLEKIEEWFNINQCNCSECEREKDMAVLKQILEEKP